MPALLFASLATRALLCCPRGLGPGEGPRELLRLTTLRHNPRWLGLLYTFVFVSGASGLIYEIVWIRALGRHFGVAAPAVSTVLAAFMAGLALGNLLFGRRADTHPRPLRLYRLLELGIAGFGLAGSLLLLHADPAVAALARLSAASGAASGVVRFAVAALLLLLPTTLMGGTLPVLARAMVSAGVSGRVVGSLYAVNTAGAVLGALLPDLVLVPRLGLTSAVLVAVLGNLAVALGMGRMDADARGFATATPGPASTSLRALGLFAVSGFVAMGAEVLWSRLLEHWVAGLVTSFSMLLAVFLVFLALGSWITRRWADAVRRPLSWAAGLLALTGPAIVVPVALAHRWLVWQQTILPVPPGVHRPGLWRVLVDACVHSVYLEGPACLLFGAAFPFLAAAAIRHGSAGHETGRLYAVNTVAGVAGSVMAGFVLLPRLGLQGSLVLLACLAAVTGGAVVVSLGRRRGAWPTTASLAGLVPALAVAGIFLLPADHLRRAHFAGSGGEILSLREGTTTTAAVVRRFWHRQPAYLELLTPGVTMSATNLESRRYMGMMGHLGAFLTPEPRSALLICYGVGNTATSLLSHPSLERLDVVDISTEVLEASREFAGALGLDPLEEERVEVFVDDGRHHLVVTDRSYDVITSEPPPPNHAGVVNLYSREYYRLARGHLRPGGVLSQWLPVFQLSATETRSIVAAFVAEFPHAALFYGWGYQWILVGSDEPLQINLGDWRRRASEPAVARDLHRIGVDGAEDLAGSFLQDDGGLRAFAQGVRPVSDDYPVIQYPWKELSGADDVPAGLVGEPGRIYGLLSVQPPSPAALHAHLELTRQVTQVLQWWRLKPSEWWELAYGTAVRQALALRPTHDSTRALLEVNDERVAAAMAALADGRRDPGAAMTWIRRAFYEGRYSQALAGLEAMGPDGVNPAHYWMLRGACLRALGRPEEAARFFLRAAQASGSQRFRLTMESLAEDAAEPFPPELGPLAGSGDAAQRERETGGPSPYRGISRSLDR